LVEVRLASPRGQRQGDGYAAWSTTAVETDWRAPGGRSPDHRRLIMLSRGWARRRVRNSSSAWWPAAGSGQQRRDHGAVPHRGERGQSAAARDSLAVATWVSAPAGVVDQSPGRVDVLVGLGYRAWVPSSSASRAGPLKRCTLVQHRGESWWAAGTAGPWSNSGRCRGQHGALGGTVASAA